MKLIIPILIIALLATTLAIAHPISKGKNKIDNVANATNTTNNAENQQFIQEINSEKAELRALHEKFMQGNITFPQFKVGIKQNLEDMQNICDKFDVEKGICKAAEKKLEKKVNREADKTLKHEFKGLVLSNSDALRSGLGFAFGRLFR